MMWEPGWAWLARLTGPWGARHVGIIASLVTFPDSKKPWTAYEAPCFICDGRVKAHDEGDVLPCEDAFTPEWKRGIEERLTGLLRKCWNEHGGGTNSEHRKREKP